ncbi:MAG: DUF2277 domain-containing protein [Tepidiformaceae bacterium]
MCRSIKTLRNADPEATLDDVRAAALQYVRKLSGFRAPSRVNAEVFEAAVAEVAASTERLLSGLAKSGGGSRVGGA